MMNRRSVLRSLALAPVVILASRFAFAKDAAKPAAGSATLTPLGEQEPLAKAMKYAVDATKAGPMRADKTATCFNCSKYNVCAPAAKGCKPLPAAELAKATAAPCEIFADKSVAKDGWCLSWTKKG